MLNENKNVSHKKKYHREYTHIDDYYSFYVLFAFKAVKVDNILQKQSTSIC